MVTGATNGIGLEIARGIAAAGATVVMHGRNPARCEAAAEDVQNSAGSDRVSTLCADLSSMEQTRRLADQFLERHDRLHILINNAATLTKRRELTSEGFERMFAVNHLAVFQLTQFLLDPLLKSAPSQVINISSNAHRWVRSVDFDNLQQEKGFNLRTSYGMEKLMNLLHAKELARRHGYAGLRANAHHPGEVATGFGHHGPWWMQIYWSIVSLNRLTPAQAAAPIVKAALQTKGPTGRYFELGVEDEPSAGGTDMDSARRLWQASERLLATEPTDPAPT